jgi:hypothetical protein
MKSSRDIIARSEAQFWNFYTLSLIIQEYRFVAAFTEYVLLKKSVPVGNDAWENNLGYVSHHVPGPNFVSLTVHFAGAILWIGLLLYQKWTLHLVNFETDRRKKKDLWIRHRYIGYALLANLLITIPFGIYTAITQKMFNVRIYFYFIGISDLFTAIVGTIAILYRYPALHRLCMCMSVELPGKERFRFLPGSDVVLSYSRHVPAQRTDHTRAAKVDHRPDHRGIDRIVVIAAVAHRVFFSQVRQGLYGIQEGDTEPLQEI